MARKSKIVKPRRLYIPVVPANASWFESDSYDRRTWNEIVADASGWSLISVHWCRIFSSRCLR
jgi:hypothetical protein